MATAPDNTKTQSAFPGLPRVPQVPSNIVNQDILSRTSVAGECFIYQRFSSRLQAYLVDYVNKSYGDFPIFH